jgi:hypothetical protein
MAITKPTNNTWVSAYQPFEFVISGENGFPFLFSGVTDEGGKAQFTSSVFNAYGTAPGKYLFVPTGTYTGVHNIVSVNDDGDVLTNTDYNGNQSSVTSTILSNHIFRLHHGYPFQTDYVEVKPIWIDGVLRADLSKFIQSLFTPQPPVAGMDTAMFTHLKVQVYPAADYLEFLEDNAADIEDTMEDRMGEDWQNFIWFALNGTLPNDSLNAGYLAATDQLLENDPILFTNGCSIFSKIINDNSVEDNNIVYNIITCPDACPIITLNPAPFVDFDDKQIGESESSSRVASGGTGPYTYQIIDGALPPGLTLNSSTGLYTGTYTTAGEYEWTTGATDSNGCQTSQTYSLTVIDIFSELNDFILRVQDEGSDITGDVLTAYEDFFSAIYTFRSKIVRLNLFAADDFNGVMVPLFNTNDGSTLIGNLIDTNNNFVSGDWSLITGLKGNQFNKYLDTGVNIATCAELGQNDMSLGLFTMDAYGESVYIIGAGNGSSLSVISPSHLSGTVYGSLNAGGIQDYGLNDGPGLYVLRRNNNTQSDLNMNGVQGGPVAAGSAAEINFPMYVFGFNLSGSATNHSGATLGGYIFAQHLSAAECTALYNAWTAFNTEIGR